MKTRHQKLLPPIHVTDIKLFNFFPCPFLFSEKLKTGIDGGVMGKTPDIDPFSKSFPAIFIDQVLKDVYQSHTMKRVVGLCFHFAKISNPLVKPYIFHQ